MIWTILAAGYIGAGFFFVGVFAKGINKRHYLLMTMWWPFILMAATGLSVGRKVNRALQDSREGQKTLGPAFDEATRPDALPPACGDGAYANPPIDWDEHFKNLDEKYGRIFKR